MLIDLNDAEIKLLMKELRAILDDTGDWGKFDIAMTLYKKIRQVDPKDQGKFETATHIYTKIRKGEIENG